MAALEQVVTDEVCAANDPFARLRFFEHEAPDFAYESIAVELEFSFANTFYIKHLGV